MDYEYILFTKYAIFKGGTAKSLFEMKKDEIEKAGVMYWGYSDPNMSPEKDVLPFLKAAHKNNKSVFVLFSQTKTFIKEDYIRGEYISHDKKKYEKVPENITLHGAKYAFIMDQLQSVDFELNLFDYTAQNGKQKGKLVGDVIKHFTYQSLGKKNKKNGNIRFIDITHIARLIDCVYVK